MIITTNKNLELMKAENDTAKMLLENYPTEEKTSIKSYGNGVTAMYLPEFVRVLKTSIQLSADNSRYIEVKRIHNAPSMMTQD
jgi:hypothetical protein